MIIGMESETENDLNKKSINKNYDYTQHTLLKSLYMFNYNSKLKLNNNQKSKLDKENIVYFLIEPETKSIISFDLFLDIDFSCMIYFYIINFYLIIYLLIYSYILLL